MLALSIEAFLSVSYNRHVHVAEFAQFLVKHQLMCFLILKICDCFGGPNSLLLNFSVASLDLFTFFVKYTLVLFLVVALLSVKGINDLLGPFAFLFYSLDKNFVIFLEILVLFIINKNLMISEAADFECRVFLIP